ncbi:MAG TPA: response regulator [Desulfurivibrionaceae bacterium]|nr:response regulator [Desulfurivibrionaceae bacterium]
MVESVAGLHHHISLSLSQLLENDEIIVVVDDDAAIREPLRCYLEEHRLAVAECDNGADLMRVLAGRNVALVLLDIGLPDIDGVSLLPQIVDLHPDLAVVMLTGVSDLAVALDCMRKGATDYLTKPVQLDEIFHVARKALEKRRLVLENRKYQAELEEAHFRIQLLHQLSIKMNTVYLSTVELDEILRAILVGITAHEGLGFNRAFLAMYEEGGRVLKGRLAIGPSCREEAGKIWNEMKERAMNFLQIVHSLRDRCDRDDTAVNRIVRELSVPATATENILITASRLRHSIAVSPANGCVPMMLERKRSSSGAAWMHHEGESPPPALPALAVPHDLIQLLGEDSFVVVPLYSPGQAFGVIIADNYVTRRPILDSHISSLELFASQASLAIEQSHMYLDMQKKIAELQALYEELDKNKDQLVAAERYSAIGQMAAQLVHTIRNPITSIGGVSRILAKKTTDEGWLKYLNVIIRETARLESTLEELFDFVSEGVLQKEQVFLCSLAQKTLLLLQNTMVKQNVVWNLECPEPEPIVSADPRQLRQVLLQLFKNGIEAMPEGGTLTVSIRPEEGWVEVVVHDTGIGLAESQLAKAKDPFFTTKTYGTGMGLTLVEKAVAAHGGEFSLKTREGDGMEARVRLPLH